MITARITSEYEDSDGGISRDVYELETDAGYNPDSAEDLMRRVSIAAKEDRAARLESISETDTDE
jgi:hypothetical protein